MASVRDGFRGLFMRDFAASFILRKQGKFEWDEFYEHRKLFALNVVEGLLKQLFSLLKSSSIAIVQLAFSDMISEISDKPSASLSVQEKDKVKQLVISYLTKYSPNPDAGSTAPFFQPQVMRRLSQTVCDFLERPRENLVPQDRLNAQIPMSPMTMSEGPRSAFPSPLQLRSPEADPVRSTSSPRPTPPVRTSSAQRRSRASAVRDGATSEQQPRTTYSPRDMSTAPAWNGVETMRSFSPDSAPSPFPHISTAGSVVAAYAADASRPMEVPSTQTEQPLYSAVPVKPPSPKPPAVDHAAISQSKAQLDLLRQQISQLKQQREQTKQQVDQLVSQQRQMQQQSQQQIEQQQQTAASYEQLRQKYEQLNAQYAQLKQNYDEANAKYQALVQQVTELNARLEVANQDIVIKQEEISELQAQKDALQLTLTQLAETKAELQTEIQRKQQERDGLVASTLRDRDSQLVSLDQQVTEKQRALAAASQQVQEAEQTLAQKKRAFDLVEVQIQNAQDQLRHYEEDCAVADKRAQEETSSRQLAIDALICSQATLQRQVDDTAQQLSSLSASLEQKHQQLTDVTAAIAAANAQLTESQQAVIHVLSEKDQAMEASRTASADLTTKISQLEALNGQIRLQEERKADLDRLLSIQQQQFESGKQLHSSVQLDEQTARSRFDQTASELDAAIAAKQAALAKLTEDVDNSTKKRHVAQLQFTQAQDKLTQLEKELSIRKQKADEAQLAMNHELDVKRAELDTVKKHLEDSTNDVAAQATVGKKLEHLVSMTDGLEKRQEATAAAEAQLERLTASIAAKERELEAVTSQLSDADQLKMQTVRDLDAQVGQKQAEVAAAQAQSRELLQNIEKSQREWDEKQQSRKQEEAALSASLAEKQQLVAQKAEQLKTNEAQIESSQQQLLLLQTSVAQLTSQNDELVKTFAAQKEELFKSLAAQKEQLVTQNDELDKTLAAKKEQLTALQLKIAGLAGDEAVARAKVEMSVQETMSSSLGSMQQMIAELTARQEQEKRAYEALAAEQQRARAQTAAEMQRAAADLAAVQAELAVKRQTSEQLNATIQQSQWKVAELDTKREQLLETIAELETLARDTEKALDSGVVSKGPLSPQPSSRTPQPPATPVTPSGVSLRGSTSLALASPLTRRSMSGTRNSPTATGVVKARKDMLNLFGKETMDELFGDEDGADLLVDQDILDTLQSMDSLKLPVPLSQR
eukprot:TRINITY_DN12430_c0_g1_i1.p1 TRINITY_DN12430_c0_g1~~TRINITY_DN12430_c0_g1_i1.p1  ORF type:complete len:1215 (+),score=389.57 TRINITY_DN12430_c0_g1_i1:51-3695(+)